MKKIVSLKNYFQASRNPVRKKNLQYEGPDKKFSCQRLP